MKYNTSNPSWWVRMSRSVRAFPMDLLGVLGVLAIANLVYYVPALNNLAFAGAKLQVLIGIPTILFLPGYVLLAILFPGKHKRDRTHRTNRRLNDLRSIESIDPIERVALSFGMSVALIPIMALVLGTWWNLSTPVIVSGVSTILLGGIGIAAIQRFRLAPEDRFGISLRRWTNGLRTGLLDSESGVEVAINLVLVVSILAAVGAIGYAVATPYQSGQSSTLFLVTENETGAETAADYPVEFIEGQEQTLTVGIHNDEERRQPYTVVVELERVATNGTQTNVIESSELDRLHTVVPEGDTVTQPHPVVPDIVGNDLRLHYYLYKGQSAPSNAGPDSAYRDTYIWINVSGA